MSRVNKKPCQGKNCKTPSGQKERAFTFFFKVSSPLFPDGHLNICKDCLKDTVNIDLQTEVVDFLRQIDKPFIKEVWEAVYAQRSKTHPIGAYLKRMSLKHLKDKRFEDSEGIDGFGRNIEEMEVDESESITLINGEKIYLSDEIIEKWSLGSGRKPYTPLECLKMEKYYRDTKVSHEVIGATAEDNLIQLAYLSVDRDVLRREKEWQDYSRISKTIADMEKNSGFRPIDRQGIDDITGIKTFSQIWELVEKNGFRKPPVPLMVQRDIYDKMIVSFLNYYHRIVGISLLNDIPEELRAELDRHYEEQFEDEEEINDSDYEDLEFTVPEDEVEEIIGMSPSPIEYMRRKKEALAAEEEDVQKADDD